MENYQTVGVFVSVIGIFLSLFVTISFGPLGGIMFVHKLHHIDPECV